MDINSTKEQLDNLKIEGAEAFNQFKGVAGKYRSLLPDDLEVAFFSVIRKFCMFVATVAILVVIMSLLVSVIDYMSSADEGISEPEISYVKYKDELQGKYEQKYQQQQTGLSVTEKKEKQLAIDGEKLEFEKEFDEYYHEIELNLNEYAKIVGDDPVARHPVRNDLLQIAIHQQSLEAIAELDNFVEDLVDDANNLVKLGKSDVRRPTWVSSIEWFFFERKKQLRLEHERIQQEQHDALQDNANALKKLMMAGSAFIAFMFFVIILVLMRIESNTRVSK